jgi:hypothetical protein
LTGGFPLLHQRSTAASQPRQLKGNRFARAAQSSAKNEEDVTDTDLEITKARLHELSVCSADISPNVHVDSNQGMLFYFYL